MRLDSEPSSTNPSSRPFSNGTSLSPLHKAALSNSANGNSQSHAATNGSSSSHSSHSLSTHLRPSRPDYFGHDREEVARILIQSLIDLGYHDAAGALSQESGYQLESPSVAAFRSAVLRGQWADAEELLFGETPNDRGGVNIRNLKSGTESGLVLAEGANANEMLFLMRQQKFLEFLEERDLGRALGVLRTELTPLNQDVAKLHALSSLLMCHSAEDLKVQANWDGAAGHSRRVVLSELSKSISPSVMIPEHRLAVLLHQVKQNQISSCLYHNTASSPSLYTDHFCDRSQFPLKTVLELRKHSDEVWYLQFSHDGKRLASTSRDSTIIIYDTETFEVVRTLSEHSGWVAYVAWSPDCSKLISCSHDKKAKLWDMHSGDCITIDHHTEPVSSCSWAPDGLTFVTGSMDKQMCAWNLSGNLLYTWKGYRINDCVISPDGRRLICVSTEKRIHVYNYLTREEEYNVQLKVDLTCLNISQDSRYMLVNMSDNEIQLLDIETADIVRRFMGQKQGHYVIRSAFGGASENFVISGSEDSRIYIWHKDNGTLVETLEGHSGCVNSVAWNPKDPCMFASAGDDHVVR
ncbi:hypothetical protein GP486_003051, partial [Trichoglossum hirsutum]